MYAGRAVLIHISVTTTKEGSCHIEWSFVFSVLPSL